MPIQPNKSVVGENAFRHASGIHQDGVLKGAVHLRAHGPRVRRLDRQCPWSWGKLSGRAGLRARLEDLGYVLSKEELDRVFESFKVLADKKQEVTDRDLEALMAEEKRVTTEPCDLLLWITSSSRVGTTISPRPRCESSALVRRSTTTPPRATGLWMRSIRPILRATGVPPIKLEDFQVHSVTEGLDSIGEVVVRVEKEGKTYMGRGASTDIIVASAKAYLSAVNRLTAQEGLGAVSAPLTTP